MSFGIYLAGYIILIVGLAIGAHLLTMPPNWIDIASIHDLSVTRHKDPAA